MLLAGKTFFLSSRDDLAVDNERRCAVMIEAEMPRTRILGVSKEGIDERSDCAALRQYDKATEQNHHEDDR